MLDGDEDLTASESDDASDEESLPQESLAETRYLNARRELLWMMKGEQDDKVRELVDNVVTQVKTLKEANRASVSDMVKVLESTLELLDDEIEITDFRALAQTMQGSASLGMQILGGLMMALGVAVAAVATGMVVPSVAVAAAVAGMTIPSVTTAVIGMGFFAYGREKGLAKAMNSLTSKIEADQVSAGELPSL